MQAGHKIDSMTNDGQKRALRICRKVQRLAPKRTCRSAVDTHGEDKAVLGFGPEEEAADRHAVLAERLQADHEKEVEGKNSSLVSPAAIAKTAAQR